MSPITKRKLVFTFIFVALMLSLLVAAAEIWLRVEYSRHEWRPPVAEDYASYPYEDPSQHARSYPNIARMSYDPFLGYIPTANYEENGYRTNGQHFRYDEEIEAAKPDREVRIFVTGGSTAWGAGVSQHQTYAYLLEERLSRQPELQEFDVRVIPAAAGAYVSTQERIFVLNHVLDYDPDIIVMLSGANDVYEGYRGNRLLRNQDFMEIRRALSHSGRLSVDVQPGTGELPPPNPPVWSDYSSKLAHRIAMAFYAMRNPASLSADSNPTNSFSHEFTALETRRNVHAILDASRRHEIDFLFYLQPFLPSTQKQLADWEVELVEKSELQTMPWYRYVREAYPYYRRFFAEDAQREGYLFADGDEAIAHTEESVFVDDYHLGDRGNFLIAEHLYDLILDRVVARAAAR